MKEAPYKKDNFQEKESLDLKELVLKHLHYWPWFLAATILFMALGYAYMRYTPITYQSVAKIKIIDDSKELNVATDVMAIRGGNSINLENEIEVLKSYRLLSQVVSDLNLNISYYWKGNIKTSQIWNAPFVITKLSEADSIASTRIYELEIKNRKIIITDEEENFFTVDFDYSDTPTTGFPFGIELVENVNLIDFNDITYIVVLSPLKDTVLKLATNLQIQATNKDSEILRLSLKGESADRSEAILNTIIAKFDEDGILDRQLVSKRTLEVIDKRFIYLSGELDSIEVGKQDFKQINDLSYIESDAGVNLQKKSETETEVFKLETQISLSQLLKKTVAQEAAYSLLPAEIGLSNTSLNSLVFAYNELALERNKLVTTVGPNHPNLVRLSGQMERGKLNILNTVNVYQNQLRISLDQLTQERDLAGYRFSKLPEKEKLLRGIEREQSIKENLFLLLLEKREEAAIKMAATAPSIKVVDYGLTSMVPVSPKKMTVYALSLALGMFLPFLVLFIRFSLDNKIYDLKELEKLSAKIPVVAEIPLFKKTKSFIGPNDRSPLAESFRILGTNVNYLLPKKSSGNAQVIYVTSAIKGEGKTLLAFNLSVSYAILKKKVLVIGADLRNPSLHEFMDIPKNARGLSQLLSHSSRNWRDYIYDGFEQNTFHKICYDRKIPLNATELLSGTGFGEFLEDAKKEFDYIIVDTAPTILVTDTLLISQYADITLFVARAGYTEKRLVDFSRGLAKTKKLRNMAYVLNGVGQGKGKGYNYGYGYGYGAQN